MGIGWQAGLLAGLARAGVAASAADVVIGTSAGSVVGAQLTLGMDLGDVARMVGSALDGPSPGPPAGKGPPGGEMEALLAAMAMALAPGGPPERGRRELGRLALAAPTMPEERFTAMFDQLAGRPWPQPLHCTAVDTATGELAVWDGAAGVDLQMAVASSCAVPGVFPPVTIGDARYMDGGMRSPLNADLAAGNAAVIVVSPLPLALPEGLSDLTFDRLLAQVEAELAILREAGGLVEVVGPGQEFLELSSWGLRLMDASLVEAAAAAGGRQGEAEADRLRVIWRG